MTPEQALLEIGDLTDGARIVKELAGGPASDSYLLERAEYRWVLRIDKPLAGRLGLDRAAEAFVLAHVYRDDASEDNIGPRLEYLDVDSGIQLTRYLPGRAWTSADLHDEHNLSRIGSLLRQLHAIDAPAGPLNLRDKTGRYAGMIGTAEAASRAT
ncbi:MAG: phosphotransferase, partial [Gammaproteobacteria bacterium]|nr:phosphotransferase [Gammaproteobacteria bacterium]